MSGTGWTPAERRRVTHAAAWLTRRGRRRASCPSENTHRTRKQRRVSLKQAVGRPGKLMWRENTIKHATEGERAHVCFIMKPVTYWEFFYSSSSSRITRVWSQNFSRVVFFFFALKFNLFFFQKPLLTLMSEVWVPLDTSRGKAGTSWTRDKLGPVDVEQKRGTFVFPEAPLPVWIMLACPRLFEVD